MVNNIYEPVDFNALAERYIIRDGYVFLPMTYPYNVFDAILIRHPQNAICFSPRLPYSKRDLDEHIALINELKLEKAVIIAENIDFIVSCPSIKHLKVKTFIFSMNVTDGDLYPCLNLSYVFSKKNRKHYNLKDSDLPKGKYVRGNENIEVCRRLE